MLLFLSACGGDEDRLAKAQLRLERGDLATAEALLGDLEGDAADGLRQRLAEIQGRRAAIELALTEVRAKAPDHAPDWARAMLAELRRGETDPGVIERIDQFQSDLASELAARRRAPLRSAEDSLDAGDALGGQSASTAGQGARGGSAGEAGSALARAREAQQRKQWSLALALAAEAAGDPGRAAEARLAQASIESAARVEAEELLSRAKATEKARGALQASLELQGELTRFPDVPEFSGLRREAGLLAERSSRAGAAASSTPPGRGAPPARAAATALGQAQSAEECAALATFLAGKGELADAESAWREAERRGQDPGWQEECRRSAAECAARAALREELREFARVDPETARALELTAEGGLDEARFAALRPAELELLVERAHVSPKAELGWCVEAILRGDAAEREAALTRLASQKQRGRIDGAHASKLVAQAKGLVGQGGWVLRGGRWVEGAVASREAEAAQADERAAGHAAAVGEFRRASVVERGAALERIRAQGDPALLAGALEARWLEDWERVARNPNLRQFLELAADRRELDTAREQALALIFDEERYFYPYNPPECPPDKAAKYAAVQREVDQRVQAVREIWERPRRARIGEALGQLLADVAWLREQSGLAQCNLSAPPEKLAFAEFLAAGGEIGVAQFAWDAAERKALDLNQRIEARNERLWDALARARPAPDVPGHDEAEQVRVTNAYRRMLGRSALAWNPKLQFAAQGHSEYMANTGDFGHFEQGDPARRTPQDRMQLAGYRQGVSENCSMGRGDPKSAHEGWTHSSGHHRNLLMPGHREMASAIASSYWTQNFGLDATFLADL